jgi:hypothetical protein
MAEGKAAAPRRENPLARVVDTPVGRLGLRPVRRHRAHVASVEFLACGAARVNVRAAADRDPESGRWSFDTFETVVSSGLMLHKAVGREAAAKFQADVLEAASAALASCDRVLIAAEILHETGLGADVNARVEAVEEEIRRRQEKLSRLREEAGEIARESAVRIAELRAELERFGGDPGQAVGPPGA